MTRLVTNDLMTLGTRRPRIGVESAHLPSRYLTIDGQAAFQIGYACGTCGLVLRRQPGPTGRSAAVAQVRDRLNTGLRDLDPLVIDAFAAQIPQSDYLVMLLDVVPTLVTPGSAGDYFAVEGPAGWRNDEWEYSVDPANTPYYRLGHRRIDEHDELFEFAMPMTDPAHIDAITAAGYANTPDGHPTAVAFAILDVQGPWFRPHRHWGLTHLLLDGHPQDRCSGGGPKARQATDLCLSRRVPCHARRDPATAGDPSDEYLIRGRCVASGVNCGPACGSDFGPSLDPCDWCQRDSSPSPRQVGCRAGRGTCSQGDCHLTW